MLYSKPELDFTSSSSSTPKHPAYYVQSPSEPSRYSHDDMAASVQASPAYHRSPMDSPLHSSTYGRSSNPMSSSASRISGNWRYLKVNRKRRAWQDMEHNVIHEGGVYDDDDGFADQRDGTLSPYFIAVIAVALFFAAFCSIIWGASRLYKAQFSMQGLKVHNFHFGEGSDRTGVPTKFITLNCTAIMSVHNPATFFGIYVSSKPADLMYLEISVATGEFKKHYQPRRSFRTVLLNLDGQSVPLYGAGATLDGGRRVPLKLDMKIESCGYLIGGIVKTKHHRHINCSVVLDSKGTQYIKFNQQSCTYD